MGKSLNYSCRELGVSSGEGPQSLSTIQRIKLVSGLWFLYLVFKVLYLFIVKSGKRGTLMYGRMLKFKLGFEHFQLRLYGEKDETQRTKIPFVCKLNSLSFNTGVCAEKLDPVPFKFLKPEKTQKDEAF